MGAIPINSTKDSELQKLPQLPSFREKETIRQKRYARESVKAHRSVELKELCDDDEADDRNRSRK